MRCPFSRICPEARYTARWKAAAKKWKRKYDKEEDDYITIHGFVVHQDSDDDEEGRRK